MRRDILSRHALHAAVAALAVTATLAATSPARALGMDAGCDPAIDEAASKAATRGANSEYEAVSNPILKDPPAATADTSCLESLMDQDVSVMPTAQGFDLGALMGAAEERLCSAAEDLLNQAKSDVAGGLMDSGLGQALEAGGVNVGFGQGSNGDGLPSVGIDPSVRGSSGSAEKGLVDEVFKNLFNR